MIISENNDLERIETIKNNVKFLMKKNNIPNITALSKAINVPATTLYSFLNNPLSSSKVKEKLCDLFDITVNEFECYRLSEIESSFICNLNTKTKEKSDDSIAFMSNDEVSNFLYNETSSNKELEILKRSIVNSYESKFRQYCGQAKIDLALGNFKRALCSISTAFWMFTKNDIKLIKQEDLLIYLEIAKHFNDEDMISKLVDTFTLEKYYNEKLLTVLGALLEKDYPIYSQICFETVINERIIKE